eukprot:12532963-Alexandrium_andersonii.AAC.1
MQPDACTCVAFVFPGHLGLKPPLAPPALALFPAHPQPIRQRLGRRQACAYVHVCTSVHLEVQTRVQL